jgi:hypothetical protein
MSFEYSNRRLGGIFFFVMILIIEPTSRHTCAAGTALWMFVILLFSEDFN